MARNTEYQVPGTARSLTTMTPQVDPGNTDVNVMPKLPRPQTSVIIPPYGINHLEERLRVIPVVRRDNG